MGLMDYPTGPWTGIAHERAYVGTNLMRVGWGGKARQARAHAERHNRRVDGVGGN